MTHAKMTAKTGIVDMITEPTVDETYVSPKLLPEEIEKRFKQRQQEEILAVALLYRLKSPGYPQKCTKGTL